MLSSTQLLLLTSNYQPYEELGETSRVDTLDNSGVVKIDLGVDHSCVIGALNQMKCWGSGEDGKTGHENTANYGDDEKEMGQYLMFTDVGEGLTFTEVGSGGDHTCALINDGSVRCWGRNDLLGSDSGEEGSGARGDGYQEMGSNIPPVLGFGPDSATPEWNATSISVGSAHSCSIVNNTTNDELRCWGDGSDGRLGMGSTDTIGDSGSESMEVDLPLRGGLGISQVSAGHSHTCLLWVDGEVACWGSNTYGELGIGNTNSIGDQAGEMGDNLDFVDLPSGRTAVQISAGEHSTCAVLDNGGLVCWGWGDSGRLGTETTANVGDGANEMGDSLNEVDLGSGLTVEKVSVGFGTVCTILDDGDSETGHSLKCWGKGDSGGLGLGDAVTRGDNQYEMGNYLPAVNLGSSLSPVDVSVGENYACSILNNSMVKCWGSGIDGRTGLGKSGATGDESGEMGDDLDFVELFLPEPTVDQPCDLPAEGSDLSSETLDSTSSYVGNKTDSEMTHEGCGALVYVDETNRAVRFAIFTKGKWSTETVFQDPNTGGYVSDVSLAFDSEGGPLISVSAYSDMELMYFVKSEGEWVGYNHKKVVGSSYVNFTGSTVAGIEVDGDGNVLVMTQSWDYGSPNRLLSFTCSSTDYGSDQCLQDGNWVLRDSGYSHVSLTYAFDTAITDDGVVLVAHLRNDSWGGNEEEIYEGYVHVTTLDGTGWGPTYNTTGYARADGVLDTDPSTTAEGSASLAVAAGLDGSIHVSYLGPDGGLHTSSCTASCGSAGSWVTEDLSVSVSEPVSGVMDLAVASDLSKLIITGTESATYALQKSGDSWSVGQLGAAGGADWVSVDVSDQGKMWAYAFYPGTSSATTVFIQEGKATAGLLEDIDGDGWSRLDEQRCGTDHTDSGSSPTDSDGDGVCDPLDGFEESPFASAPDSLSVGESFACAVLSNGSIACWGDNSDGQLGSVSAGSNSAYAVLVDLPDGFEARSVGAGTAHACSEGLAGDVVCWGRNTEGQLGRGATSDSETPGYVVLPSGVLASKLAVGADHNCFLGTDQELYCWGNASDERTGKVANPSLNTIQYENFTDNSRSWVSNYPNSYLNGPAEGLDYISKEYYWWWLDAQIYSDASFELAAGDVIDFNMRGRYHGDNGYTSEWIQVYANNILISQVDSNSTTRYSTWSDWNRISITVPDSYTGSGMASIKFRIYGYYNEVDIDDLRVINRGYGGLEAINEPRVLDWSDSAAVSDISLGNRHSCALMISREVNCWGDNGGAYERILGDPSFTGESSTSPRTVDLSGPGSMVASNWTGSTVDGISAGDGVTCAAMLSAEALCWGSSGQTQYRDPAPTTLASAGDVGRSPALTTDANGDWLLAYNDGGGISYARYNGSAWTAHSACAPSDECDGTRGVGVGEDTRGGLHFLTYNEEDDQLMHTRSLWNITTTASVTGMEPSYFGIARNETSGHLHLVFYRHNGVNAQRDLVHSSFNGTGWSEPEVVDGGGVPDYSGSAGRWKTGQSLNGLEMDSVGRMHVSYWDWYDHGSDRAYLKYAHHNGTSWVVQTLQSVIGVNNPIRHTSLAIDSNDRPHISYYDPDNETLRYTHYNGTAWVDQTPTTASANGYSYGFGRFSSIALDSNDYPRIAFRNEVTDDLELVTWDGTGWSIEAVDTTNNVGSWASLAIDSNDLPRIAYIYDSYGDLRYASHDGASWSYHDIDTSVSSSSIDLHLDESDRPRIAYKDSNYGAWLAYNNSGPDGQWETLQVRNGHDIGSHMAMALDGSTGTAYMAYQQDNWPSDGGFVSTVYTGTVLATGPVADTGETSNTVAMGPELVLSGDTVIAPFLNGTAGADPSFVEMVTIRSAGTEITTVDGESHSVGSYGISMALDGSGNQHVSYLNASASSLMYARGSVSGWHVEEVDNTGSTGYYSSIAVDDSGNPHITYVDMTTTPRVVMYAHHNGTSWTTEAVDSPYYAFDTSIDLDSGGNAHITYSVYNSSGTFYNLRYSYHNGSEWVQEDVRDYSSDFSYYNPNTGRNSQIRLNSTDTPHVVFFDDHWDDVYHSVRENGSWSSSSVDDYGGWTTTGGERAISLAIDSTDGLHVAYFDISGYSLEYAHRGPGESTWTKATVHDQGSHSVGTTVSIAVDGADRPHIAFHDRQNWDLEYARFDGSNWLVETLEEYGSTGRHPSIAIGGDGTVNIAYENYSASRLMSLVMGAGLGTTEKVAQVGTHGYGIGFAMDDSGDSHLSFYNGTDS
ncbi:MAG: hypothetical protein VW878_06390, partial [Candidatus Poseidoniales archaeon]